MSMTSPWANFGNGFYSRMKQAGFEDGLGIPRSLMREIASDANRQYFIEGAITRSGDGLQVTARVWDTRSMEQLGTYAESGWDLYGTIDSLSEDIRHALDIPKSSDRIAQELPLVDTYGESQQALRDYVAALNARLFDNDIDASNAYLDSAVESDPGFVRAWFLKTINFLDSGDLPSSQAAIQKAQELDYRLPALDRARVKQINYRLTGQTEKLISFLRMQVRLRDDAASHSTLAGWLMVTGELEEAKQEFLASLARDALNLDIYLQLAALEKGTGNMDAAIGYARDYLQEKPEDVDAQVTMGDLLRDAGNLTAAEEHYLEATLLDNQPVVPTLKLAFIAIRNGNENEARSLLEQAEGFARTSQDHAQVRAAAVYVENRLGRLTAAIEQLYRMEEYLQQSLPPFEIALSVYAPMIRCFVDLQDTQGARAALDKALSMVQPPLDQFLAFGEAAILLHEGDLDGAEAAIENGIAIIDQFKAEYLKFQVDLYNGYINYKRGDYAGSAVSFKSALEKIEHSFLLGGDINLILPALNAALARSQIFDGELEDAQKTLDRGFEQDPSEPTLWVSKARFQLASGQPRLALASVNYALAIWSRADPEYREYMLARELQADIQKAL
jgi:tetratricopeptide (TPR) repeat protein